MDNLILEGKVIQLLEPQSGTSTRGAWKKQDFVIETEENYPKKICITGFQDMADKVAELKEGQSIKASVNIESREYNTRWYTDVKVWRIEAGGSSPAANAPAPTETNAGDDVTGVSFSSDESDDLPF